MITSHTRIGARKVSKYQSLPVCPRLQLERVRAEQGDAAAERCGAGFYYSDSATTRYFSLALPRTERGMRATKIRGVNLMQANYFRIIRPATGVSYGDIYVAVRLPACCIPAIRP